MRPTRTILVIHAVAGLSALALGSPVPATGQVPCPSAIAARGHIGVAIGCDCTVNATPDAERPWQFRSPIRVTAVEPGGAASGRLRVGDLILSVDGADITTPAGARRLADVAPGQTVTLDVLRNGERRRIELRADAICPHDPRAIGSHAPSALTPSVRAPAAPGRAPVTDATGTPGFDRDTPGAVPTLPDLLPPGHVGFALSCAACGWEREQGQALPRWHSTAPPRIYAVESNGPAEAADLRPGDILLAVDGFAVTTPTGGAALGAAAPGRPLRLTLRRGTQTIERSLVPRARPAAPAAAQHRYTGSFGGVQVQITSPSPASVSVMPDGAVMRIVVNGTVVQLTVPAR